MHDELTLYAVEWSELFTDIDVCPLCSFSQTKLNSCYLCLYACRSIAFLIICINIERIRWYGSVRMRASIRLTARTWYVRSIKQTPSLLSSMTDDFQWMHSHIAHHIHTCTHFIWCTSYNAFNMHIFMCVLYKVANYQCQTQRMFDL